MNLTNIIILVLWLICGVAAFYLSWTCYSEDDDTPAGVRLISASLAFVWNILYLFYYVVTVYVLGVGCPN